MSSTLSTYYGLTKIRNQGPEARDWAATDHNVELVSLLLKAFEQHKHNAAVALSPPAYYTPLSAPTVAPQGTPGSTSYSYYIVATGTINKESPTGATTTGNATLNATNFNRVSWSAVAGATGYDVIRLVGGTTQGKIISVGSGTTQYDDQGAAGVAYTSSRQPALSELSGGIISPGSTVSIRLSYRDALGLETAASPESFITLSAATARPLTPQFVSQTAATPGLPGGSYVYAITKKKGSGETVISDLLPVEIPYDTTYSVTISFDAINTYSDGTTDINIYRSSGLNTAFQLVSTVTTSSQTQFTDTNTIPAPNANVQPPSTNTFDANKKVRIDWSALSHPASAKTLVVYATRQTGLWSNEHLLAEVDLAGSPPTYVDYLGSETLSVGWPLESSQIPTGAPKLDLATEATGAPILTSNMNFAGFQAQNLKLHNNSGAPSSPTNGYIYYDTSIPTVRAYINGAWVNWGTTAATAYTHPAEEAGGHIAANLKFVTSGTTLKTILDRTNDASGNRKQVTKISKSSASTSAPSTNSTSWLQIPQMQVTNVAADFNGQYVEVIFNGHFWMDVFASTASFAIALDGTVQEETVYGFTCATVGQNFGVSISWVYSLPTTASHSIQAYWMTSGTNVYNILLRRYLYTKVIY